MDQQQFTQLTIAIATILMSGVVSGFVTFQLNTRRDARSLRREKLEAIFESFNGFTTQLGAHWIPYISVMEGKIDYNQALDMTNKSAGDKIPHLRTLEMLIAIYFPNLQRHLDALYEIREAGSIILQEHKERYREIGPHKTNAAERMVAISNRLCILEADFLKSVRSEAGALNQKIPGAA